MRVPGPGRVPRPLPPAENSSVQGASVCHSNEGAKTQRSLQVSSAGWRTLYTQGWTENAGQSAQRRVRVLFKGII